MTDRRGYYLDSLAAQLKEACGGLRWLARFELWWLRRHGAMPKWEYDGVRSRL